MIPIFYKLTPELQRDVRSSGLNVIKMDSPDTEGLGRELEDNESYLDIFAISC